MENLQSLLTAFPYIKKFSGKIFVIKCGGATITDPEQLKLIAGDIALLYCFGINVVMVHGGGQEITQMCKRNNISTQFVNGQRVTDASTMEIVQMVLHGKTNRAIVTEFNKIGIKSVGISGQDSSLINVTQLDSKLGFVGKIKFINAAILNLLLSEKYLPVISTMGIDDLGQSYNVNADIAAGAIAGSLKAEKFIVLSDVNGLYADINDPASRIEKISCHEVINGFKENRFTGGMIPKLEGCVHAIENGALCAQIIDGKMPHSLLMDISNPHEIGTLIQN